ncbi:MAG: restriction endonuclease subunit S [Burkholderiales bacterium]|nr:restriction endonuclease subunit S [Burkholderiales bacterium]
MTRWRLARLDKVAEVTAGNPAPQEPEDFSSDGSPFVRMQDVGREHHTKSLVKTIDKLASRTAERYRLRMFPRGTLLIPKSGASVNLNHRALLGVEAYVVSHLATVVPRTTVVDPEFLYYWSLTYDPRSQAQTTSLPSLPTSLIKAALVPVPSLEEQRRIVDLLSRAEGIVRLRREAQAKAAEIIPALFLETFGDPATNPKGWPVAELGDHIDLLTGFAFKSDEFVSEGDATRLCRGANVLPQCIDWSDVRYWPNDRVSEFGRFRLADGDIVLAMDRPWISTGLKVARIGPADLPALLVQRVARIRPLEKLILEYVYGVLCHRRFALHCNSAKTETLVPHISPHDIRSFPVLLAPLQEQKRFAVLASQHSSICQQQTAALVKAEAVFHALLSRVFSDGGATATLASEEAAVA